MVELTNIQLTTMQYIVLATAIGLLIAQLLVQQKKTMHLLFALFCGSVAMATAQKITGDSVGAYQYLIGMGACATCNGYWLLARAMFREKNPFSIHHVLLAASVGVLVMMRQGYLFVDNFWQFTPYVDQVFTGILREITMMLSSLVLLMGIWEGCRGFTQANQTQKAQRLTFLGTFVSAIVLSKIVQVTHADSPDVIALFIAGVTVCVMGMSQLLIIWIHKTQLHLQVTEQGQEQARTAANEDPKCIELDHALARQIQTLIIRQQQFLQANLKVADIARALDVSEYRISRVLKHHFQAKNFNQFVNALRIQHAQKLLADPDNQKWPVLVVGLESGFASVGPFTRAFKQFTGVTPNQYRQDSVQLAQQL